MTVSEILTQAGAAVDERERTLQIVISVLARVPDFIKETEVEIAYQEEMIDPTGGRDKKLDELIRHRWSLNETLRIARLYTIENALEGVAVADVIKILQDGLA